jgi:hypothetical protein
LTYEATSQDLKYILTIKDVIDPRKEDKYVGILGTSPPWLWHLLGVMLHSWQKFTDVSKEHITSMLMVEK